MSNESENKQENDDQYVKAMLEARRETQLNRICESCGAPSRMHTMRGCFDE